MLTFYYLFILSNAVSHAIFGSLGNYFPIDSLILAVSIMASLSSLQGQKTFPVKIRRAVRGRLSSVSQSGIN